MSEELHNYWKPYFDIIREHNKLRSTFLDKMDKKFFQDRCDHEYDGAWLGITGQPCKKCGKICEPMRIT